MLYIHGSPVRKISGPISMAYLLPPQPGLPIVLLFGDHHYSLSYLCHNCKVENDCYAIYGEPFLQKLDHLAETYPVDFFTETYRGKTEEMGGGALFGEMTRVAIDCHDVPMRSRAEYEFKCPTRNIRWHYADARFFEQKAEFKLFGVHIVNYLHNRHAPKSIPVDTRPISDAVLFMIRFALQNSLSYAQVSDAIADTIIKSLLLLPDSMIRKQGSSIDTRLLWKMPTLSRALDVLFQSMTAEFFERAIAYLSAEESSPPVDGADGALEHVYRLLVLINVPLLDIYHVTRMVKPILETKLVVSFLGDTHSINIAEFLQHGLGYTLDYAVRGGVRCLEPMKRIDIQGDLARLGSSESYLMQLARERAARESSYPIWFTDYFRQWMSGMDRDLQRVLHLYPSPDLDVMGMFDSSRIELGVSRLGLSEDDASRALDCVIRLIDKVFSWTNRLYSKKFLLFIEASCLDLVAKKYNGVLSPEFQPFVNSRLQDLIIMREGVELCPEEADPDPIEVDYDMDSGDSDSVEIDDGEEAEILYDDGSDSVEMYPE